MATGRERLQSIIAFCGVLQDFDDEELDTVVTDLAEVDSILVNVVDALEEEKDA